MYILILIPVFMNTVFRMAVTSFQSRPSSPHPILGIASDLTSLLMQWSFIACTEDASVAYDGLSWNSSFVTR